MLFIIVALTAHDEDGNGDRHAWQRFQEVTDVLSDVCNMTPVPCLLPLESICYNGSNPGNEPLLDLCEASESGGTSLWSISFSPETH